MTLDITSKTTDRPDRRAVARLVRLAFREPATINSRPDTWDLRTANDAHVLVVEFGPDHADTGNKWVSSVEPARNTESKLLAIATVAAIALLGDGHIDNDSPLVPLRTLDPVELLRLLIHSIDTEPERRLTTLSGPIPDESPRQRDAR